jgi:hypothetical protein
MANLTVREYDDAEAQAISLCPNSIIEAFAPVHFSAAGYPMRVTAERELIRYLDVMHDLSFEEDFAAFFANGLTGQEFEMLSQMATLANKFSKEHFSVNAVARPSVLKAINVAAHINYLYSEHRPKILEIGPGCGYLGAFLIRQGYPYAGMDVTQAFYLYQNHFWNYISGARVLDFVKTDTPREALSRVPAGSLLHLPWWEFVKTGFTGLPEFDLVVCDHAVCEMHPHSLDFLLKIAHTSFNRGMSLPKAFIFQGWGAQRVSHVAEVLSRFYKAGYVLIFTDALLTVFVPSNATYAVEPMKLPQNQGEKITFPYFSVKNPLVQAILSGRNLAQAKRSVSLESINKFYQDMLGTSNYFTPDEGFLRFIL